MAQNTEYADKKKAEMEAIMKQLEDGVKEVFTSENFQKYLTVMSTFHNYSVGNQILIWSQKPDAQRVAGYGAWQKLKRQVQKGEKGIQILAPQKYKVPVEEDVPVLDAQGKPRYENGQIVTERKEKTVERIRFVPVYVFDISQTKGEPLPTLVKVRELEGDIPERKPILDALQSLTSYPITFEHIEGGAKGYCHYKNEKIVIKEGMSDLHSVKTAIHEVAHYLLHDPKSPDSREITRERKEVEAESIAYVVTNRLGLDTSDYSFGYIASWSNDKELSDLKESLRVIQETAQKIIDKVEGSLEIYRSQQVEKDPSIEATESIEKENKLVEKTDVQVQYTEGEERPIDRNPLPSYNIPEDVHLPTVKVLISEHDQFKRGQVYSLANFDHKIAFYDKQANELRQDKNNENQPQYYKVKFKIDYKLEDQKNAYEGTYYVGDNEGGIINHINEFAKNELELKQLPNDQLEQFKWAREKFVPFLEQSKKVELILKEEKALKDAISKASKSPVETPSRKTSIRDRAQAATKKSSQRTTNSIEKKDQNKEKNRSARSR